MKYPKLGMRYEDVRKRVKRISRLKAKNPGLQFNQINSLLNQCSLKEGQKAENELREELTYERTHRTFYSGSSNRSCGMGNGKKLGVGRWRHTNNGWVKIG